MTSSTDPTLSDADRALLINLAGQMIPAHAERAMPGADDPAIIAGVEATLARDFDALVAVLAQIRALADGGFEALPQTDQAPLLADWRAAHPPQTQLLEMLIVRAYYQDSRVRAAIGIPDRPPYPQGYEVAQGDLSLLDAVRARGQVYRNPMG